MNYRKLISERITANIAVAVATFFVAVSYASANQIFKKVVTSEVGESKKLRLLIRDEETAKIFIPASVPFLKDKAIFIAGPFERRENSLILYRTEGDVCPPVALTYPEQFRGKVIFIDVKTLWEEAGSAARKLCEGIDWIDGRYYRKR